MNPIIFIFFTEINLFKMSKARIEDCEKFTLDNPGKWTIQGFSKAGDRTGFMLYPLKILLDAGLSTYLIPNAVLLHSHTDHSSSKHFNR